MSDPQWWLLDDLVLARATIDRAAARRTDAEWLARASCDPASRFMHVHGATALVTHDSLALTGPIDEQVPLTLLGIDESERAYFSAHHAHHAHHGQPSVSIEGTHWSDLRQMGARLSATDAGLMVAAVALDNWSRAHRFCPGCGGPLEWEQGGWVRRCVVDGSSHFPRTDPAVIVLVRDDQDRALLGRQVSWEPNWFSTLAGFVEAGESAEAAVRREVLEESGVQIGFEPADLAYLGSQPWPFPGSLMLGYHAWASDSRIEVDGEEIAEAHWFSREELAAACESEKVSLPPGVSIARKLIERWFGEPLPGEWSRAMTRPIR